MEKWNSGRMGLNKTKTINNTIFHYSNIPYG
jgi:hypothetical protein